MLLRRYHHRGDEESPHSPPIEARGPDVIERPARSASKAEWLAYADQQDPGEHDAMTKEQLVEQYGG
ncbi:hypothetical protein ACH4JZ_18355 [Streptomyces sp. NPDC017615]|uniref:hypothetical protein n=1 Tax=Streptomyces sp. NPDC017615 TaxID=3365003 RepID=UPI00378BF869